jgi:hypothetical protein
MSWASFSLFFSFQTLHNYSHRSARPNLYRLSRPDTFCSLQPNALNQFISFSSLIFVSFTDFVVPWCLYIALQRGDAAGGGGANLQQGLLSGKASEGLVPDDVTVHWAVPPTWGLSAGAHSRGQWSHLAAASPLLFLLY